MEKRSLRLNGHATSLALEPEFWDALAGLAGARGLSPAALVAEIDAARAEGGASGLASAVRVYVLTALKQNPGGIGPARV